jgi:hypothetical protein
MKTKHKFLILLYFFLFDFILYAQGPSDEDGNGDLEGGDPPTAPINSKLFILATFALIYVFYKLKKGKLENDC